MKLPKLGYGKQSFLAFLKTSNEAASRNIQCMIQVIMLHTDSSWFFHTRGEMSNRSKRKCLYEDETWVQRISLKQQHGCCFSVEWQQRSYPIVMWKLFTSILSSFPFFCFCNYFNCYYYVTLFTIHVYFFTNSFLTVYSSKQLPAAQ